MASVPIMQVRRVGKQSISLRRVSYLAGTDSADLAIRMTRIVETIRVAASTVEVRSIIKQKPVIPQA